MLDLFNLIKSDAELLFLHARGKILPLKMERNVPTVRGQCRKMINIDPTTFSQPT